MSELWEPLCRKDGSNTFLFEFVTTSRENFVFIQHILGTNAFEITDNYCVPKEKLTMHAGFFLKLITDSLDCFEAKKAMVEAKTKKMHSFKQLGFRSNCRAQKLFNSFD